MIKYLIIGEILKPQGIRGEIKVRPMTNDPERFLDLKSACIADSIDGAAREVEVVSARVADDCAYLTLAGVTDRDGAEALRGKFVLVDREHAVELSPNEHFIVDLIGLEGVDTLGQSLGRLTDVLQPGGNDVYQFEGPRGRALVPALKSVVLNIDIEAGRVTLDADRLREVCVFDED